MTARAWEEEEVHELRDITPDSVDLVDKGAIRRTFLIIKRALGLAAGGQRDELTPEGAAALERAFGTPAPEEAARVAEVAKMAGHALTADEEVRLRGLLRVQAALRPEVVKSLDAGTEDTMAATFGEVLASALASGVLKAEELLEALNRDPEAAAVYQEMVEKGEFAPARPAPASISKDTPIWKELEQRIDGAIAKGATGKTRMDVALDILNSDPDLYARYEQAYGPR